MHEEIRRLCHISKTTLVSDLNQYIEGGVARLKQLDPRGQPSRLNAHAASVEAYFREHPPQTVAEAQAAIKQLTGIERSRMQVKAFLKRLGMKRRKVGFVPGKSGTPEKMAAQEQFQQEQLEPALALAKQGQQALFLSMLLILSIAPF
jgi:transposase